MADRDIDQNALISTRGLDVTNIGTKIKTDALKEEEMMAAPIRELEESVRKLETALAGVSDDGKNNDTVFKDLPKDVQDSVNAEVEEWPQYKDNGEAYAIMLKRKIGESLAAKKSELSEKALEFGGIKVGQGNFDEQLKLLEAIKIEIAKENSKKGSGDFKGIASKFDAGLVEQTFGKGTKLDNKFAMSLQNKNLQAAVVALKDIKKQKVESKTGGYSLSGASKASAKAVNPVLGRGESKKVSGRIDVSFVSKTDDSSNALMKVLEHIGLNAGSLDTGGLNPAAIAGFETELRKLSPEQLSNLQRSGMKEDDVKNLLTDLEGNVELMNALKTRLPSKTN